MRATRTAGEVSWPVAALAFASIAATVTVIAVPTMAAQLALAFGILITIVTLVMARAGRVLNGAWVVILAIYLLDPVGSWLRNAGSSVSMIDIAPLVPVPFVLAALWLIPETRQRLPRLLPLVLLLAVAVLSLAWSLDDEFGLRKLTLWVTTGLLPCAVMLVLVSPRRPVDWRLIAVAAFIYSVTVILIGTKEFDLYPGRLTFFEANPIWIARAALIGALVVLFGPFPKLLKPLLIVPMVLAAHFTDSSGPTLGVVVGVGLGIAEAIRVWHASGRQRALAFAGLAVALGIVGFLVATGLLFSNASTLTPIVDDPNVQSRSLYLDLASRLFLQAPLFGNGLGAFAATGVDTYPHNMIAEVASELGLVGLIILFGWVAMAFRGAAGSPTLVSLVAATTVFTFFSGNLGANAEFWLFTGIAVAMAPLAARMPFGRTAPPPGVPVGDAA